MAENDQIVVEDVQTESKFEKFLAMLKERGRKFIVGLKRKPQNIAFFFLLVSSVYFLLILFPISEASFIASEEPTMETVGLCMFIATLLSLLVLVSFLNSFPKRKKPSVFFICLVVAMIAGIVVCDVMYYVQANNYLAGSSDPSGEMYITVSASLPYIIGHLVLLGIAAVVFALLPVYKRLINMIDTSIHIDSASEKMTAIDVEDE